MSWRKPCGHRPVSTRKADSQGHAKRLVKREDEWPSRSCSWCQKGLYHPSNGNVVIMFGEGEVRKLLENYEKTLRNVQLSRRRLAEGSLSQMLDDEGFGV